jgi:hypothetical protein
MSDLKIRGSLIQLLENNASKNMWLKNPPLAKGEAETGQFEEQCI